MSNVVAAFVTVLAFQAAPAQVEITAAVSEVEVQGSVQLTARAIDGSGRVMTDVPVRWISSTPEIAVVDQTGRMVAMNPGVARITAVVGGQPTSTLISIHELPAATVDAALQADLAARVASRQLTVRQTEALVASAMAEKDVESAPRQSNRLVRFEHELGETLGAKVTVRSQRGGRARVVIDYPNAGELDNLLDRLK